MYRRKRKHDHDSFVEAHKTTSIKDKGLLCRDCGKWRKWGELDIGYEYQSKTLVRMWICDQCSCVLREDELT